MTNISSLLFTVGLGCAAATGTMGIMGNIDPRLNGVCMAGFSVGIICMFLGWISLFIMCSIETSKTSINYDLKNKAKMFIDHNIWDGEDRSGCKTDSATFNPDELQQLVDDFIEHINR